MDPQLEGYLRKIFGSLSAIEQNQERQKQEHSDLVQQVESMKYSIASQNDRLEEMSSLTMPKSFYRPDAEGSSERAEQSNVTESLEGMSLLQLTNSIRDIVAEVKAQKEELKSTTEILKADILKFTEAAKKIKDYQNETEKSIRRSTDEISKILEHQKDNTERAISGAVTDISHQVKDDITNCCNRIKESQEASLKSATADIVEQCVKTVKDYQIKTKETLEKSAQELSKALEKQSCNTESAITSAVTKTKEKITEEISQARNQIQQTQELKLKSAVDNLGKDILKCTETIMECQQKNDQTIATKFGELSTKVYRSKLEVFYHVEKECQLIRDCQQPIAGVPGRKKYIGYFYIENFKALIRSGEAVHSYPWRIDQFQSSVQGYVRFKTDGDLKVCLVHGRHSREVGLEQRSVNLSVTATVTDLSGRISNYLVGQVTWTFNEENMPSNRDWGRMIDSVSCQKLVDLGFASKEKDYQRGAILIRYEIEVV